MLSNTHLRTFVHKFDAGKYSSQHILQAMSLRAHMLQNTSCAAKVSRHANVRIRRTRTHLSVSRPQQDAKYNYLVSSRTRSTIISSPAGRAVQLCTHHQNTHLTQELVKREVDHYNCPLIGGGKIGLVKEIQLVGDVRTHVLSLYSGRSTTTSDNS